MVAWEDDSGEDGSGDGVFAQIFNPTGSKVGGQFQVNTYTNGNQFYPSVSSLSNANFVVTWEDSQLDGNGTGIFAQIFNVSDVPLASTGYSTTGVPLASTGYSTTGVPLASTGYSTTGVPLANTGNSATSSSAGGSGTSGISISTGNPGSMGTTGLPGTSTSASSLIPTSGTAPAGISPKSLHSSSPSGSSHSSSWLWPFIGVVGGVTCLATTAFAALRLRAKRRQSDFSLDELNENAAAHKNSLSIDREEGLAEIGRAYVPITKISRNAHSTATKSNLSPERKNKGHTEIGRKYALITKISRNEAELLLDQTGIEVIFPPGKNKAKILLGQGNFGKLRIARNLETGLFAGVKKVKGASAIEESRDEGALQAKLEGKPNIMPIWDCVESLSSADEPVLYQFMPLAGFGNGEELQAHLHAKKPIQPQVLMHVATGMATGLFHMHAAGIYHLDIKLSNLVLDMMERSFLLILDVRKSLRMDKSMSLLSGIHATSLRKG